MLRSGAIREVFELQLHRQLSPSSPIRRLDLLKGRLKQVTQVEKALTSPGRHVFVYGDRGVGKTSLAQAVAYDKQRGGLEPVFYTCDRTTDFSRFGIALMQRLGCDIGSKSSRTKFDAKIISHERETKLAAAHTGDLDPDTLVGLIEHHLRVATTDRFVIIDEFDQAADDEFKSHFAAFLKQCSDQRVPLKFLTCGIGMSLDDLLSGHGSVFRYIAEVQLDRLSWDARQEIIIDAAKVFGVHVDAETLYRIAAVSDGFPHYVHLVGEKLFWHVFEDPKTVTDVTPEHYASAVADAVAEVATYLSGPYKKATQKYSRDYEEVLWAVADHEDLERRSKDIYESYVAICQQTDREPMTREKFNGRMNRLKDTRHANILKGTRSGWYSFSENIVRGYVRLRAEQAGVMLDRDHALAARRAS